MRILDLSVSNGERLSSSLASSLDLVDESAISSHSLDVCREFAFSSTSPEEFASWYLRAESFSKFLDDGDPVPRANAAIEKFRIAEQECHAINERLVDPWSRASLHQASWRRARALVHSILGRFPWEAYPWMCSFGPGASTEWRSRAGFHQTKWEKSTHITEGALPHLDAFMKWSDVPGLCREAWIVPGNKVFTVPKRYDTDRTCAAEPTWNMFFQKGVGGLIRQRLQRYGLLHADAQETNRALARLGSWTNSLATLDVKSASDLISLSLVEALVPDDWLKVLYDLRSHTGLLPNGETVTYGKISSMGNGYTFELETLLFYALACAVCGKGDRDNIKVYGDDIICPSYAAPAVIGILMEAGFQTNTSKSFIDGPFRESCGGHYWLGRDVTPFYLRQRPRHMNDVIVLANHCTDWVARCDPDPELKRKLASVFGQARALVPKILRGPYGLSGVLWDEWDRCCPTWRRSFQSYRQKRLTAVTTKVDFNTFGGYLHALWVGTEENEASWGLRPRERYGLVTSYVDRDMWKPLPVRLA